MNAITDPKKIALARMQMLRYALRLEIKGMKRRGRSAYSIIKQEFGFTGSKQTVLAELESYIFDREEELKIPQELPEPTCWQCRRPEHEHVETDYGEDGCCIRIPAV